MTDLSILCGLFSVVRVEGKAPDDGLTPEFLAQPVDRMLGLGGAPIDV